MTDTTLPDYHTIAEGLAELLVEKQAAYGDSFSKSSRIFEVLYPNGVPVEKYRDFLAQARVIDKMFRIANREDAFGESPWLDITGYGLLSVGQDEQEKLQREEALVRASKPVKNWVDLNERAVAYAEAAKAMGIDATSDDTGFADALDAMASTFPEEGEVTVEMKEPEQDNIVEKAVLVLSKKRDAAAPKYKSYKRGSWTPPDSTNGEKVAGAYKD